MSLKEKIKSLFNRQDRKRRETVVELQNFTADHKNMLVIAADPETDIMVVAYKNFIIPVHFNDKNGKWTGTIRNSLDYKKLNNSVDTFLLAIDGALASIATTEYNRKHGTNHKLPYEAKLDIVERNKS